jgi:hypothetical protein
MSAIAHPPEDFELGGRVPSSAVDTDRLHPDAATAAGEASSGSVYFAVYGLSFALATSLPESLSSSSLRTRPDGGDGRVGQPPESHTHDQNIGRA